MKRIFILISEICFLLFISVTLYGQTPDWLWAKSAGGGQQDDANAVATDSSGNVYVGGLFRSSRLTLGSVFLQNSGESDIFLQNMMPTVKPSGSEELRDLVLKR
jgi:hypothetical protein